MGRLSDRAFLSLSDIFRARPAPDTYRLLGARALAGECVRLAEAEYRGDPEGAASERGFRLIAAALFRMGAPGDWAERAAVWEFEERRLLESAAWPEAARLIPEESDHLYRLSNLISLRDGTPAELLTRAGVEIAPGRSCAHSHRHPFDDAPARTGRAPGPERILVAGLQRFMEEAYFEASRAEGAGRGGDLFLELGMLESQHAAYARGLAGEYGLREAAGALAWWMRDWRQAGPAGEAVMAWAEALGAPAYTAPVPNPPAGMLEAPLSDDLTLVRGEWVSARLLPRESKLFAYRDRVVGDPQRLPSAEIATRHAAVFGSDYRFEREHSAPLRS